MAQVKTDHITRNTHCLKIENFAHGCTTAVSKVQVGRSQKEVVDYHSEQGHIAPELVSVEAFYRHTHVEHVLQKFTFCRTWSLEGILRINFYRRHL